MLSALTVMLKPDVIYLYNMILLNGWCCTKFSNELIVTSDNAFSIRKVNIDSLRIILSGVYGKKFWFKIIDVLIILYRI